jgi:signal transduction histidine kinase
MRRRLTLTVLAVTSMVTVAFLIPLGAVVKVVAADRALSAADQEAGSLSGIIASETSTSSLQTVTAQLNAQGGGRQAAIYLADGARIGAPLHVPAAELALARQGRAFSADSGNETRVWVPVRLSSGVVVGVVSVPDTLLRQGVLRAWLVLAAVGLAVLALAMILSDRLGRSMVRSIEDLGHVTRRLSTGDLDARVEPAGPPEIAGVGLAVNALADRIIELLALEREEAADLSHRLRTPLAALKLEAESLQTPIDQQRMGAAVHDLTQAVNDVIIEVRQARTPRAPESCDITGVVRERLEFWSLLAEEQDRPWTCDLPDDAIIVQAPAVELAAAVDALIGNVLAHTPEHTAFGAIVSSTDRYGVLTVEDEGPGFPQGVMPRRGQSGGNSTGLGLDIVQRTAERAHGGLTLGPGRVGGARVEVQFALEGANPLTAETSELQVERR